ncbi:hypothetical protein N7523_005526 [Penicillium sp. IBT 18751x]|nr:hypothetical protein N7523_005888 [Penicillium sp. IBT 18751x]KAJ6117775.1 hypothetical protein N7523_005526 [Penicillium sp. IBT 18751x]
MFANSHNQKKIPKPLTGLSQWEKDLKSFLASISTAQEWNDARKAAGFATIDKNGLAIQLLLGTSLGFSSDLGSYEGEATPFQPQDDIELITRGCQYGRFVARCADDAEFAIRIAKYQQLVFVCFCTVLIFVGNSEDTINWMMRQFISDSDSKNLRKYRSGCLWVNRCIVKLLEHRWGYKSWEIFMLFAQPLHLYGRLAENRRSLDIFVQSMGAGHETAIFEEGYVPYCLPCIVKVIAGDKIGLPQICECLGYDLSLVSWVYRVFFMASNPFDYMSERPRTGPMNLFAYTQ